MVPLRQANDRSHLWVNRDHPLSSSLRPHLAVDQDRFEGIGPLSPGEGRGERQDIQDL